jgi:hypothetical protein
MTARQAAQVEAPRPDPVRDDARAVAVQALASHRGIIRSLSAEQRRAIADMDAGPALEVGSARVLTPAA